MGTLPSASFCCPPLSLFLSHQPPTPPLKHLIIALISEESSRIKIHNISATVLHVAFSFVISQCSSVELRVNFKRELHLLSSSASAWLSSRAGSRNSVSHTVSHSYHTQLLPPSLTRTSPESFVQLANISFAFLREPMEVKVLNFQ